MESLALDWTGSLGIDALTEEPLTSTNRSPPQCPAKRGWMTAEALAPFLCRSPGVSPHQQRLTLCGTQRARQELDPRCQEPVALPVPAEPCAVPWCGFC